MKRTEDSVVLTGNIWNDQKLLKTWVRGYIKAQWWNKRQKAYDYLKIPRKKKTSWQSTA